MKKILITILVWHIIQVIYPIVDEGFPIGFLTVAHLIFGFFILLFTYYMFKGKIFAFRIILIFLILQSFSMNFTWFEFSFYYSFLIDIHILNSPIGFNPITIILFVLLLVSRKEYKKIGSVAK